MAHRCYNIVAAWITVLLRRSCYISTKSEIDAPCKYPLLSSLDSDPDWERLKLETLYALTACP